MTKLTNDIIYIGASDNDIDLFESQYPVPDGMAYNSYVIIDDKIAVMDTADRCVSDRWQTELMAALDGRQPDYLVVQHLEPDHSANIGWFTSQFPEAKIVLSSKAASMLPQFFRSVAFDNLMPVKEGDKLSLGKHGLTFLMAPMVHWPEVMVSYDAYAKCLFSADAFGKFGATSDEATDNYDWTEEARRYYYNICGKYGIQVQGLLKKAVALDIQAIYPLHGPVISENVKFCIDRYQSWSTYTPEAEGVLMAYASIHGNTKAFAEQAAEKLMAEGIKTKVIDLARTDVSYALSEAFDHRITILAASSYDAGVFPSMENFLLHLKSKNFNNRKFAVIENGSWAPTAARTMNAIIDTMKNIEIIAPTITVKTTPDAASLQQLDELIANIKSAL